MSMSMSMSMNDLAESEAEGYDSTPRTNMNGIGDSPQYSSVRHVRHYRFYVCLTLTVSADELEWCPKCPIVSGCGPMRSDISDFAQIEHSVVAIAASPAVRGAGPGPGMTFVPDCRRRGVAPGTAGWTDGGSRH